VSFPTAHGTVGVVKPTYRPGSLEEFIRLLPEGIGVVPLFIDIRRGTEEEFASVLGAMEEQVAKLAEIGVDLIHPEGAPPFMQLGVRGESDLVTRWERRFGVPIVTASQTQVEAMRALGLRRVVGVTYFTGAINDMFARYFGEAGFEMRAMAGIDVPFEGVGRLASRDVYDAAVRAFRAAAGADGVYLLGSGWRVLDIVEPLERELGVPVIHAVAARVWAVQKRLAVPDKHSGYGRLLAEMPTLTVATMAG
jgi:maleate cis-trans isomerase